MTQFCGFYARIAALVFFGQRRKKALHFGFNDGVVTDHGAFNFPLVKTMYYPCITGQWLHQFREIVFGEILTYPEGQVLTSVKCQ